MIPFTGSYRFRENTTAKDVPAMKTRTILLYAVCALAETEAAELTKDCRFIYGDRPA